MEEYLRALLRGCRARGEAEALTPAEFVDLLTDAFATEPEPYDAAWEAAYSHDPADAAPGFARFERTILRQIVDLREMRVAGILDQDPATLYFGVDAPRGGRWYNVSSGQYLECAAAGSLGGWEPGDDTGRQFVPGEVAALDERGEMTSADPRDLGRPVHPLGRITWEQFEDFLYSGQVYE